MPSIVRILATSAWGPLFDAFNFFLIRGLASFVLLVAMLTFFFADTIWCVYLGSARHGLALASANVNWSLWVTKSAPEGQASNYMTVHSSMTGARGLVAPFIGFYLITALSIQSWVAIGSSLVRLSIVMLIPISQLARR